MEKIYLVVEHYIFEGVVDEIKQTAYKSKESAIKHFHNQVHREETDSWVGEMEDVITHLTEIDNDDYMSYYWEAYEDGYAMEYSSTIYIKEIEPLA